MKHIIILFLSFIAIYGTISATDTPRAYVSIAADANFLRFSSRDSIDFYLDQAHDAGFNHIVLDVKPNYGKVLYRSQILPYLDFIEGVTPEPLGRDWDYLQYFIDGCHSRDMKLSASFSMMPVGSPYWQRGICYTDSIFDPWLATEYRPDGSFSDMRDTRKAAAFLNPALPEVKAYVLSLVAELVTKYDIDGFSLDYCRYPDAQSDLSQFSRQAFESWLGLPIENWPADVLSYDVDGNRLDGKYIKEWWAWRAGVIADLVRDASTLIHSIKPHVEVEYWAATWIHGLQMTGQNWASSRSRWPLDYYWGTNQYSAAGFADALDVFAAGAYLERVHGADDNESVEYALNRARDLLMGDCTLVGSLYAINHSADPDDPNGMYQAASMSLAKTGHLRVFDISQIHRLGLWPSIRRALDDYTASASGPQSAVPSMVTNPPCPQ